MDANSQTMHAGEKQPPEFSKSINEDKGGGKDMNPSLCINYGAAAWCENRRKWLGDQTQQTEKGLKDPIISWSTTYEELLLTNEPFSKPIPLAEMVDFLVDHWHMEELFD